MATVPAPVTNDYLIRGSDYLAENPGFKLIGRKPELNAAIDVLMRKSGVNNLVLYGPGGVGLSSLLMGLQASKEDLTTPFDIVGKKFYYLDVDALFASADPTKINEGFQKTMETLSASPDTVLVIEDIKDFLDGVKNNGVTNIMNVLMRAIRTNPNLQAVFEAHDEDLSELFKSHSDIAELFSLKEVREPPKEELRAILENIAKNMEEQYGVKISQEALDSVSSLTTKYPGAAQEMTLAAQPKCSAVILEGALMAYCREAHANPPELAGLEETLGAVTAALAAGKVEEEGPLAGKSKGELETIRLETENSIKEVTASWEERQKELRQVYADQRSGESAIQEINAEITNQLEKETYLKEKRAEYKALPEDDTAGRQKILDDYKGKYGEIMVIEDETKTPRVEFNSKIAGANFSSAAVGALEDKRRELEKVIAENKAKYTELTKDINENLALNDNHVLAEFSRLSGVPMNKLKQDESQKLIRLADTLKERVFGQDEPVEAVAKAVKRGRTGLKKPNKPIGSFLFLGPSGVGKTELAKALAAALFGDESALKVYNMSEYAEKHASAVLIGAPPGYEGYAEGGVLTNAMRKQPYCVNVFDEAEKADKQVFDLFLQMIDEGVLTDRRGISSSFANSINILTSNVGAKYFLDESLSFEEAKKLALADLWNPEGDPNDPDGRKEGFRPEFLNRFTGIFCFNRLGQPEIIMIAGKTLKELNSWVAEKGITIEMPEEDLKAMCKDQYEPKSGGRGIMHYIEDNITSEAADTLLLNPDQHGVLRVSYEPNEDREKAKVTTEFVSENAKPSAKPAKKAVAAAKAA